jgi:RimJ/RimL family protein N-acetyltransferase
MSEIKLEFDYVADEEDFIELIGLMLLDQWVGDHGNQKKKSRVPTEAQINETIKEVRENRSWMVVRLDQRIVGCSIPTPVIGVKAKQAKVPENAGYWKIGPFFIHPDYQGKGLGTKAALAFKKIHPKLVYMYEDGNVRSQKVAIRLGLPFRHYLYVNGDEVAFYPKASWENVYKRFFVHHN